MKILIIGRNEILLATAQHLIENTDHEIVGIITAKASPEYLKNQDDFRVFATDNSIPFLYTERVDDNGKELINNTSPDIAVSVNWVSVITSEITELLPCGFLNAHLGDLPFYRGNAVTNWALLNGEKSITATIHKMEPGVLDSGDIYLKKEMILNDTSTIRDINRFAEKNIPMMFAKVLDGINSDSIKPISQNRLDLKGFRCYPRLPGDSKINWGYSAKKIDALVRSSTNPYSGAYTYYRTKEDSLKKLYIWESRVICEETGDIGVPGHIILNDSTSGESHIYTGSGIVALKSVSHGQNGDIFMPGEKWKSIRMRLGLDIEEEIFRLNMGER